MSSRKKVYISGKITGIENEAPLLFAKAEGHLIQSGHDPVNPMSLPHLHDKKWTSYMKEDLIAMLKCDGAYFLKNWRQSTGAIIEHMIAEILDMEIIYEK